MKYKLDMDNLAYIMKQEMETFMKGTSKLTRKEEIFVHIKVVVKNQILQLQERGMFPPHKMPIIDINGELLIPRLRERLFNLAEEIKEASSNGKGAWDKINTFDSLLGSYHSACGNRDRKHSVSIYLLDEKHDQIEDLQKWAML